MAKKYMVYRNGSITIRGASVEIKIGDFVKESVFRNYPNYIYEVEDEEIVEPVNQVPEKEDESTGDDTSAEAVAEEVVEETVVEEPATEAKPKRGKK